MNVMSRHAWKIIFSAIGLPTLAIVAGKSDWGRQLRFKHKFNKRIANSQLNKWPYVPQSTFENDLIFAMTNGVQIEGGVRIVWSVAGAGKTTTIKNVVNRLIDEKKVAGCIYITPSHIDGETVYDWFVRATSDGLGPIIRPGKNVSSVVGYDVEIPYIVVLDQMESSDASAAALEHLVRNLAYDSACFKGYLTLLVTNDVHIAEEAFTWNGGTKITFLGTRQPWLYKWGKAEVDKWIEEAIQLDPERLQVLLSVGSPARCELEEKVLAAGTPALLVTLLRTIQAHNGRTGHSVDTYIETCLFGWKLGEVTIRDVYKHMHHRKLGEAPGQVDTCRQDTSVVVVPIPSSVAAPSGPLKVKGQQCTDQIPHK